MSSPLDGRIRTLAREEAAQAVREVGVLNTTTVDTHGLQQQITDLHEHLHHAATVIKRLEDRLDVLEKATGQTDQEPRTSARRTARKDTGG
jgi:hypothetical protein